MQRLQSLNAQVAAQETTLNAGTVSARSADDVVVVSYARTAVTRAKKGPQKDTAPEAMLLPVFQDVLKKANNLDPKLVEDICVGNVLQPGGGPVTSRMAQLLAGIPASTALYTVNR